MRSSTEPSVAVDAEKVLFRSGQMHLIEHYGSGIRRIKDECDANGNVNPIWRDNLGTFSTTYLPRNAGEGINAVGKGINEGITVSEDTIRKKEGLKRESLVESQSVSLRTIARLLADLEHEGKIIYRGSKKTGGYCAVKQED